MVDDKGRVRHLLTAPNADADEGFSELLEHAVNVRPIVALRWPNDVWEDRTERE